MDRDICAQSERDIGRLVNMLSRKTRKRIDRTLAEFGITGVQGRIMHFIERCAESGRAVYQRDVETEFALSRSTVTNILNNLEKNGLIRRESVSSDGRLKSLEPTERADEIHRHVKRAVAEIEDCLKRNISEGQLMLFYETIETMLRNLDD